MRLVLLDDDNDDTGGDDNEFRSVLHCIYIF
jgi:hypothetical protein